MLYVVALFQCNIQIIRDSPIVAWTWTQTHTNQYGAVAAGAYITLDHIHEYMVTSSSLFRFYGWMLNNIDIGDIYLLFQVLLPP